MEPSAMRKVRSVEEVRRRLDAQDVIDNGERKAEMLH